MIILIGNFLSKHGLNPTAIEDLYCLLEKRYQVKKASDKKNKLLRLLEMVKVVTYNRKICKIIIVDVFSTTAFLFFCQIVFLARLFKIPYVPVMRGGDLPKLLRNKHFLIKLLLTKAHRVICPSKYLHNFYDGLIEVKVIPNYIDIQKYGFILRKRIKPNILWVRSIHAIYNPMMALKVLQLIREKYINARLCFVGPIKDKKIMNKLQSFIHSNNLIQNVEFSGHLSKKDWINLSLDYDIFINTTNIDNTPITLLESMALGLPIVSTDVGGVGNLLENEKTGFLVEKNNSQAMYSKIDLLLSDDIVFEKIVKNARQKVLEFDRRVIAEKWYKVIDELY